MAKYIWPQRKIAIHAVVIQINDFEYVNDIPLVKIEAWQLTEHGDRIPLVKDIAILKGDTIYLEMKSGDKS